MEEKEEEEVIEDHETLLQKESELSIKNPTNLQYLSFLVDKVLDKADKIVLHGVEISCNSYFED